MLKDLEKSALELAHICSVLLDENVDIELLRTTIFEKLPPARLAATITFINAIARPPDASFHDEMVEQYERNRRLLPCLLGNIEFSAAPADETTLEAIRYLAAIRSTRRQHIDDAPMANYRPLEANLLWQKRAFIPTGLYPLCYE